MLAPEVFITCAVTGSADGAETRERLGFPVRSAE
jgi:hypothetical protein